MKNRKDRTCKSCFTPLQYNLPLRYLRVPFNCATEVSVCRALIYIGKL